MRERDSDNCSCGNLKLKKSKTCSECYAAGRPPGEYVPRDSCECGRLKMKKSAMCQECRDTYRSDNPPGFRGPVPDENEAAIYLLRRNSDNKVFYVGSSKNPRKRLTSHRYVHGDITMIVIKLVPVEFRWQEEIDAMLHYGFYTNPRAPKE